MNIVFDLISLAILVLIIINGAKKGLASMAVSCIGTVVAVLLALSLSAPAAELAYNALFEKKIQVEVDNAVASASDNPISVSDKAAEILVDENGAVARLFKTFGITDEDVKKAVSGETAEKIKQNIITNVVKPPLMSLIKTVMTLLLATIFLILVWILSKAARRVFKATPLRGVDKGLGGTLGFIEGLVIVYLFVMLVKTLTVALPNGFCGLTAENLNLSYSYRLMTSSVPEAVAKIFSGS